MKKISTCLWFDHQAQEAAALYSTVFKNSKLSLGVNYGKEDAKVSGQKEGSPMTLEFTLEDLDILGLNGGPHFKFTPSFSLAVSCSSEAEINEKWQKLSEGGKVRMALDKYPWAEKYGWTTDRFDVEWQLTLSPRTQKISPSLLFVDKLFGKGEEAVNFYVSTFPNSKIEMMARDEATKSVMYCAFSLNGLGLALMEGQGKHGHTFSEATSLIVSCESQKEVDSYWDKLSEGGSTSRCGWLKDKFGVSWQIIPSALAKLMSDPSKSSKVMKAMLQMKKLDIAALERAANS